MFLQVYFPTLPTIPAAQDSPDIGLVPPPHYTLWSFSCWGGMCLFSHLSAWMPVVPLFLCYLFVFVLMLRFLCQIKYWHRQVPEIKVVPAYALVDLVFHFHDFISQENSNYVTSVERDANNIKPSQLHCFHPKGFFQWEDGKFLKTKQATWAFCFNRRASLFCLHVGRNWRHFAFLTSSPWTPCAYKVASPHPSHNQYWPWPRGHWATHRDSLQSGTFCRAQRQGCVIPEVPPLHTRGCCCQGQGHFAGDAPRLSFFALQLCGKKGAVTAVPTTNKSQATAIPFCRSLFDGQHKMSVCSPSNWDASSHKPASGPPPSSNVQPR